MCVSVCVCVVAAAFLRNGITSSSDHRPREGIPQRNQLSAHGFFPDLPSSHNSISPSGQWSGRKVQSDLIQCHCQSHSQQGAEHLGRTNPKNCVWVQYICSSKSLAHLLYVYMYFVCMLKCLLCCMNRKPNQ